MDIINKRVFITKGKYKGEFGTILEIKEWSLDKKPLKLLIETNKGKIAEFDIDDVTMKWDYKDVMKSEKT